MTALQTRLVECGYPVAVDGDFGAATCDRVGAFQSQHLDQHGQPLVVDGRGGPTAVAEPDSPEARPPASHRRRLQRDARRDRRWGRVQGLPYVFSRMDKLLGFDHLPDAR